jgi:hypothetical protein
MASHPTTQTPDEVIYFDIAVSVRSSGTAWIRYDFASAEGSYVSSIWQLEIPT